MAIFIPRWDKFLKKPTGVHELNHNNPIAQSLTDWYLMNDDALSGTPINSAQPGNVDLTFTGNLANLSPDSLRGPHEGFGFKHNGTLDNYFSKAFTKPPSTENFAYSFVAERRSALSSKGVIEFSNLARSGGPWTFIQGISARYRFYRHNSYTDVFTNTTNQSVRISAFWDGTNWLLYQDTVQVGSSVNHGATTASKIFICSGFNGNDDAVYGDVAIFNKPDLDAFEDWLRAPYVALKPRRSFFVLPAAGGQNLAADSGSYNITGSAVNLVRSLKIQADQGSYALTGSSVNLIKSVVINADQGSYSLTGSPVNLVTGNVLSADAGNYSLIGSPVNLIRSLKLGIDPGIYTLSGSNVDLIKSIVMGADQGSYSLTGGEANLLRGLNIKADEGIYTINGSSVNLIPPGGLPDQSLYPKIRRIRRV